VPAKVLQAAWAGRFDEARRLLRPTIEHHATPARRAHCWAQMAVFHAAVGDSAAAANAAADADVELHIAGTQATRLEFTLLLLALAAWTAGDAAAATKRTRAAEQASSGTAPRLLALRELMGELIAGIPNDEQFATGVSAGLARLRESSFGGLARLIEQLPYRFCPGPADTVLRRLARREFPRRFAASVAAGEIAPLTDWLESVYGRQFSEIPLHERFDRWTAVQCGLDTTTVMTIRGQLAAYRPPAPAIVALLDDIDTSIDVLFENLDTAAPLMAEHSRAVSAWCSRIARAFGLSEREIAFITRCGLIHDIGKMRTPAEILNAPRRLEPAEWAIMRDHAAVGGQIIADHPMLVNFVPIVRGHHERLDGRGYPDGLRAGAIPFAARIVSVADSFNAMIGRRPYRLPMTPTDALGELDRNRHTQFDPEVVEAMIRIVQGRIGSEPLHRA
jgi:putative nucleotidyltransferase with HDIG domain